MKNIDRLIGHYVLEIIFTIVMVVVSIPVWNMIDKSADASMAKSYATMNYLYLDVNKYVSANTIKDVVSVKNDTKTSRGYNLILKVKKNTINNDLVIIINNEMNYLNKLEKTTDKEYNYYSIKTGNLVAGKEDITIEYNNSNIDYSNITYDIIESREA